MVILTIWTDNVYRCFCDLANIIISCFTLSLLRRDFNDNNDDDDDKCNDDNDDGQDNDDIDIELVIVVDNDNCRIRCRRICG